MMKVVLFLVVHLQYPGINNHMYKLCDGSITFPVSRYWQGYNIKARQWCFSAWYKESNIFQKLDHKLWIFISGAIWAQSEYHRPYPTPLHHHPLNLLQYPWYSTTVYLVTRGQDPLQPPQIKTPLKKGGQLCRL